MSPNDIIGTWFLDALIPIGRTVLRINGKLTFVAEAAVTFDEHFVLRSGDRILLEKAKQTGGTWTINSNELLADFPGRDESPFTFTLTSDGGLQWYNGKVWRRTPLEASFE